MPGSSNAPLPDVWPNLLFEDEEAHWDSTLPGDDTNDDEGGWRVSDPGDDEDNPPRTGVIIDESDTRLVIDWGDHTEIRTLDTDGNVSTTTEPPLP